MQSIHHSLLLFLITTTFSLSGVYAQTPDALRKKNELRCEKLVFYAQTVNHKKEVEICLVSPSVSYSFGKTGAPNKEMELIVPTDKTSYASQNNQVIRLQEFTIRNGNTTYQVSAGTNDEGHNFATLDVYQGTEQTGKHLAEIKLDPKTMVNNIDHSLANEGIPSAPDL